MENPTKFMLKVPVPWVFILVYLAGYAVERGHRFVLPEVVLRWSWVVGMVVFGCGVGAGGVGAGVVSDGADDDGAGAGVEGVGDGGAVPVYEESDVCGAELVYLGEAGMLRQVWPVIFFPLMWAYLNWTVIPLEEGKLTEAFPQEYPAYQRRVRRWI